MKRLTCISSTLVPTLVLALGTAACRDDGGVATTDGDGSSTTGDDVTTDAPDETGTSTDAVDETGTSTGEPEQGSVRVLRDARGVPHVIADTDEGAFHGLGWASAEDRLVQMHVTVLSAQGRLAEHFGLDYVDHDLRMRTMGYWRHAEQMAQTLDAEHLALLEAFAAGVNAHVAAHPEAGAARLSQLGIEPQAWTPAHSLAAWYRVADLFSSDPLDKALASEEFDALATAVGIDAAIAQTVGDVHPGQPEAAVVQAADVPDDVEQAIHAYAASMGYGEPRKGAVPLHFAAVQPRNYGHVSPKFSHAWAVSGERTTTGQPALVSDPQVAVTSPNFLYEWAIVGQTVHARGASPAGVPGLLIGFTPGVAWGMTAAGIDQRDLFRLEMTDATHYVVDGVEHELVSHVETIEVAGGNPREIEIHQSLWGPVVDALLPPEVQGSYALKGLPFAVTDRDPFVAMVGMMRADDLDGLRDAIEHWTNPSANLVAADAGGHIFFTVVGDVPLRSTMSPLGGMIAQDGSSTAFDWIDLIPNEYKPWVLDPAAGTLMSANHRPVADWYPLPLGVGQGGGGDTLRSRRLRELLAALPSQVQPHEVLDAVQWDCVNAARRDLVALAAHVHALQPGRLSAATVSVLEALDGWLAAGGSMHTEQAGVFLASHLSVQFRVQQTGPALNAQFGGGESGLDLFLDTLMAQVQADPMFVPSEDAIDYLDATLAQAWDAANAQVPDRTQWDAVYASTTASPSLPYLVGFDLSQSPLGPVVEAPTLACADGNTIWSQRGETYTQWVDLAAIDQSRSVMAPGDSDDPEAAGFTAQLEPWAEGTLLPTALTVGAIEALAVEEELLDHGQ